MSEFADADVPAADGPSMTDQGAMGADATLEGAPSTPPVTGHPAIDNVLGSLEGLEGRPVDEHVGVFERAHDELRRTLADARGAEPQR